MMIKCDDCNQNVWIDSAGTWYNGEAHVCAAHVAADCTDEWCGWDVCHGMR